MKLLAVLLLAVTVVAAMAYPNTENQLEAETILRAQRQAGHGGHGGHHDAVDYGAHKGEHGSFGWYADFPVLHHGGH